MSEEEIGTGLGLEGIMKMVNDLFGFSMEHDEKFAEQDEKIKENTSHLGDLFGFSMEHDKKFAEQDEKIKSLEEKINKLAPQAGGDRNKKRKSKRKKSKKRKTKRRKPKRR